MNKRKDENYGKIRPAKCCPGAGGRRLPRHLYHRCAGLPDGAGAVSAQCLWGERRRAQCAGYAAKQPGRNAQINFRFCSDKRYVSVRNLLHYRSAFNLEFIFDVIPEKYIPFDYETFFSSEVQVHVGATNLLTGKCEFFTKEQMDRRFFPVRASAAAAAVLPYLLSGKDTLPRRRYRLPDSDRPVGAGRQSKACGCPHPQPLVCPQARLQPAADPPGLSGISKLCGHRGKALPH